MRIAQVLQSGSWGDVTPAAFERGIGGREGAMLRLAREWAKMGHDVTCFVPTSRAERHEEPVMFSAGWHAGFHEYVPVDLAPQMLRSFSYDAVVSWEMPEVFADREICEAQPVRVVEMQVAHVNPYTSRYLVNASAVAVLSEWHGEFTLHDNPAVRPEQIRVMPNGVDLSLYPWTPVGKDPHEAKRTGRKRFHYTSSPDRGLWHLLRMWPAVMAKYPEAELRVGYGATRWTSEAKWQHNRVGEMATEIEILLKQPGVRDVGQVGQRELAMMQRSSTAWLYPCDTIQPTETGCITAIEAGAAGAPMFITDCDCMEAEFGHVARVSRLPFDPADFLEGLFEVLESPALYAEMREAGRRLAEERQWSRIAPRWLEMFETLAPALT